jgi:hypothetical protein
MSDEKCGRVIFRLIVFFVVFGYGIWVDIPVAWAFFGAQGVKSIVGAFFDATVKVLKKRAESKGEFGGTPARR